jgi:hypothetical protein
MQEFLFPLKCTWLLKNVNILSEVPSGFRRGMKSTASNMLMCMHCADRLVLTEVRVIAEVKQLSSAFPNSCTITAGPLVQQ